MAFTRPVGIFFEGEGKGVWLQFSFSYFALLCRLHPTVKDIISAFSHESADADAHILIPHRYGSAALDLTCTAMPSNASDDGAEPVEAR
jgi:hypothetical protein